MFCCCCCCVSYLYILDINPIRYKIWKYFPHSVVGLFILLIVPLAAQSPCRLMKSHLCIFTFVTCAFGVRSKKKLAKTKVKELFPFDFLVLNIRAQTIVRTATTEKETEQKRSVLFVFPKSTHMLIPIYFSILLL